jgi:hypothetical protein
MPLMLYSYSEDRNIADIKLIENKISFLQNFPQVSRDRGKSFNYKDPLQVCTSDNVAGLVNRIKIAFGLQINLFGIYRTLRRKRMLKE